MTSVINLRNKPNVNTYVRVDRASLLGNPFELSNKSSKKQRAEVCEGHRRYLWLILAYKKSPAEAVQEVLKSIPSLVIAKTYKLSDRDSFIKDLKFTYSSYTEGKKLGCWCAPEQCHADSYVKLFNLIKEGSLKEAELQWQHGEIC